MSRIHNFFAGPAVLPESIVNEAREALWELNGTGIGLCEISHRSKGFDEVIRSAEAGLARLLKLDEDQQVLFLHGGASTQFFMFPMNLLRGGRASYLNTGTWTNKAIKDAKRFGTVDVPFTSEAPKFSRVPNQGEWGALPEGTKYLHYCTNNTIAGTQYDYIPEVPEGVWLTSDQSSDFLCRPLDGSKFDFIFGGAQKNLGPSGMCVAVLRKSLLDHCDPDLPTMLSYNTHVSKGSMFNTPNTFAIFVVERMCAWLEANGGLEAMEAKNVAQANKIYGVIDGSDFWTGIADASCRSLMNITFSTGSAEKDTRFVAAAAEAGLVGLKGHRSVGGLRASVYNSQPDSGVDALVAFMREFERTNG